MKSFSVVLIASLVPIALAETPTFEDTPLTTEMWKLVSKEDATKTNEALEAFLFQNPDAAKARSADKRGGLWWAWEYKNAFALGALRAYGADPNSKEEDADGKSPRAMCDDDDCDELLADLEDTVKKVLQGKSKRQAAADAELDDDDDDDDDDDGLEDDDAAAKKSAPKRKKVEDNQIDIDDDEDEDL